MESLTWQSQSMVHGITDVAISIDGSRINIRRYVGAASHSYITGQDGCLHWHLPHPSPRCPLRRNLLRHYATRRRSAGTSDFNNINNIKQHLRASPCSTLRTRACNTQKLHELAHVLIHACWRSLRVKPKHMYMSVNSFNCLLTTLFGKACRLMRHDRDRKPAKFNL